MKINYSKMKKNNNNLLLCDSETGICKLSPQTEKNVKNNIFLEKEDSIKIIYFTDPICSSCWGVEPHLRKLNLEYGENIDIEYRMGGLLANWDYARGAINKPSDVATHWDQMSIHYDMPIDGNVWLEDPLHSSYPPSIAFKAAQLQDEKKAILFLRKIREYVFLEKKNITKWKYIKSAAIFVGLDILLLEKDYKGKAIDLFNEDMLLAKKMMIRGFPTFLFANNKNQQESIVGSGEYSVFENKILKLMPNIKKNEFENSNASLFNKYPTLTAREYSELSGKERLETEIYLNKLHKSKLIEKITSKNGNLYFKNKNK